MPREVLRVTTISTSVIRLRHKTSGRAGPMRNSVPVEQTSWDDLKAAAVQVMGRAYAPYSHYPVGAAALADDGRVVVGCNVENAAYGVVLCAECGLVSQLHASGGGRLTHFVCVNGEGDVIMPCGRCRQLLVEHGGATLELWTVSGVKTMAEVLPDAFGPDDLALVSPVAPEAPEAPEEGAR